MSNRSENSDISDTSLSPEQKVEIQNYIALGFTRSQARYCVLTPSQRKRFAEQVRISEQLRYLMNPHREMIKHARNSANGARRRGSKHGGHEFTITEHDLVWPTHCPVFPWVELHYPGYYRHDPASASLDRIDNKKGYVPGNVQVISLRANLLRKDITPKELQALADYFLETEPDDLFLDDRHNLFPDDLGAE